MKHRLPRVNELIKRELGELFTRELSFPAKLVTIQEVDVTPDLKHAHVFVSIIGLTFGPALVGLLSDTIGPHLVSGDIGAEHAVQLAQAEGLRWAVILCTPFNFLAAIGFYLASRTLRSDLMGAAAGPA